MYRRPLQKDGCHPFKRDIFTTKSADQGEELMEALEFRFAFFARDFEKSIHFYRDILGMSPTGEWWNRPDGKGALLSAGGTAVVEIYGAAEGRTYEGPAPIAINLALRKFHPGKPAFPIGRALVLAVTTGTAAVIDPQEIAAENGFFTQRGQKNRRKEKQG